MADGTRSVRGGSPASSPVLGGRGRATAVAAAGGSSPPGHGFRRVTLTKPTFCHYCTDFIWGLAGYQCDGTSIAGTITADLMLALFGFLLITHLQASR